MLEPGGLRGNRRGPAAPVLHVPHNIRVPEGQHARQCHHTVIGPSGPRGAKRLLRWLAFRDPIGVERPFARFVNSHVLMGSEVVALGLQQVGRQTGTAIAVVVSQRGGKRGHRYAELDRIHNDIAPGRLRRLDGFLEIRVQQQVLQIAIRVEGLFDALEEYRADDTATSPQQRNIAEIERPIMLFRGCLQLHKSLSIAADLRSIQRLPNVLDKLLTIAVILSRRTIQ